MKCSNLSRGSFSAIEMILRDIASEATDTSLETCVQMIQDQINNVIALENLKIKKELEN